MNEIEKNKRAWRELYPEFILERIPADSTNLQNVFTPYDLCYDIVRKLEGYADFKDKTFCVFNLEFAEILCYDFGVQMEKIWFVTDCKEKEKFSQVKRYNKINTILTDFGDFLKEEMEMKFDVVIGNPPYQAPKVRTNDSKKGACGKRLWQLFVTKSFSIVKEDGFISLIHPSLWRKPENKLFNEFKKRNLKYVEMHSIEDGIKTFKASTAYDWYILQNQDYEGKTIITDVNGDIETINVQDLDCIPSSAFKLFNKLLAREDEEKCDVLYARSAYGSDKPHMSREKEGKVQYPCVYMNTKAKGLQLWYSSINSNGHFGVKKVIVSENGGFLGLHNDYKGEYGQTQFMFGIEINSKKEGDFIIKALASEKFSKIWNSIQWMSNHREWRIFKSFRKDFWKEFV